MDPKHNTLDKTGKLRPDFLFSYWIYAWFLLFYFTPEHSPKGTPSDLIKRYANPALVFSLALVENLATFVMMVYAKVNYHNTSGVVLLKYAAMMVAVKGIPLYLLEPYPIRWQRDLAIATAVFAIYNVYLYWNETDLWEVYSRTFESVRQNKPNTPFFELWNQISGVIGGLFAPRVSA
jgi:hypothetical protein